MKLIALALVALSASTFQATAQSQQSEQATQSGIRDSRDRLQREKLDTPAMTPTRPPISSPNRVSREKRSSEQRDPQAGGDKN